MSEMVEKVAVAARAKHTKINLGASIKWEVLDEPYRDEWRALARAAIEAMREPTIEMISAGLAQERNRSELSDAITSTAVYQAMIDAALGGGDG